MHYTGITSNLFLTQWISKANKKMAERAAASLFSLKEQRLANRLQ